MGRSRVPAVGEKKFFETDLQIAGDNGGVIIDSLNLMERGTDDNERVGRKVIVRGVGFRGRIQSDGTTPLPDRMRIILYVDKQANKAIAAATDILDTTIASAIDAYRELANVGRFRILYDETHDLNMPNGSATVTVRAVRKTVTHWSNVNIPLEYSGNTGTVADLNSNNLGMLFITQLDTATPAADFDGIARIRYIDS